MVKFLVETIFEVLSPKDWKHRIETIIKLKVETIEPKLKQEFLVNF